MRVLQTGYGVGDVLMATGVLRAWRRVNNGERVFVVSRFPELFEHNPDVVHAFSEDQYQRFLSLLGKPLIWRIGNAIVDKTLKPTYPFPAPGKHLMDSMATTIGVKLLPEERRPFLYLTRKEVEKQNWAKGWVTVQSSSTIYWTPNKNWIPGRMQSVVNELTSTGYKVIQLGVIDDESLQNVTDLRGKTTLREGAAILANAELFIGLEGGLIHTARAVETSCLVIYTGYTDPAETGYPQNVNLRATSARESCWSRIPCEHCRQSAKDIEIEEVVKKAHFVLEHGTSTKKSL